MLPIVEFLYAMIDEEELRARKCVDPELILTYKSGGRAFLNAAPPRPEGQIGRRPDDERTLVTEDILFDYGFHALTWSPAHVLEQCTARRRLVEHLSTAPVSFKDVMALRLMAVPYKDWDGYQDAWASVGLNRGSDGGLGLDLGLPLPLHVPVVGVDDAVDTGREERQ